MQQRIATCRRTYALAARGFVELVSAIEHHHWDQPGLGAWTVRDLTGHASRALLTVESYLDPTTIVRDPQLRDAATYFRAAQAALADPAAVADRGRQAGAALGADPAAAVSAMAERVLRLVEDSPDQAVVGTPVGTMTLVDYLPTRTFELVVHSLDLVAATGVALPDRLATAVLPGLHTAADLAGAAGAGADVLLALTGRRPLSPAFSVV